MINKNKTEGTNREVSKNIYRLLWPVFVFCLFSNIVNGQNVINDTTTTYDPRTPVYQNHSSAGEFTPGKGFQVAKNEFASLNISIYAMARYLNQLPGTGSQTWEDHLGNKRSLNGRNDFYWHRTMIWFTGFVGTPKFTYMATVWTVFPTQQTLVYGNFQYTFNNHFRLGIGITPNLCIRSLQGPFPFFTSTDRTMAEDAIRGGFTNGLFATGDITSNLKYWVMIGNNLSQLGIQASKLTRHLSRSVSLFWMPTTGEFGPRGGNGDFENHQKLATRFGASYCHSRENRFNNIGTPSPDNTQVRMSDGVLFFETGALAPNLTVQEADYDIFSVDLGFKYKGFALHTEVYYRTLSKIDAFDENEIAVEESALPYSKITDKGYTAQALYMLVPQKLCVYGIVSQLIDEFKRNPYEVGGGLNFYPIKSRSWRVNAQGMYVYKCAAGGTFGLYTAGQTGPTITMGVDILL